MQGDPSPYLSVPSSERPPVWKWYVVYVVFMVLLYLLVALMGVGYLLGASFIPVPGDQQILFSVYGGLFLVMGILFAALYGAAPFLPKKPWAWIYHLVLIAFGLSSCCTIFACVPLLIYWMKPEAKAMFERT